MKPKYAQAITAIVSYLFIVLFTYAAISKLLDFENFKVQVGQSPLLSAYADWIAIFIPLLEIVISMLLCSKKLLYLGLQFSFGLMVTFTAYIIIILNYSPFVPCSCGGILSDMNWNQHLTFNCIFVFLAIIALVLFKREQFTNSGTTKYSNSTLFLRYGYLLHLLIIACSSVISVIIIFIFSEDKIHRNNAFVRRYPQHPVTQTKGIPLDFNSYYIAGFSDGKIYLGNKTAPLHLLSIDTTLQVQKSIKIKLDNKKHNFESVQIKVKDSIFYVSDGSVPIVYKGDTKTWNAKTLITGRDKFALIEPTVKDNFVIRANENKTLQHVIGNLNKINSKYYPDFLKKKIDGVFDTDGMLLYNEKLRKIIYMYYYRNSFVVTDYNFKNTYTGKTIDTLKFSVMDFAYVKSKKEKKFATQPIMVQKYGTSAGNYLLLKSDRLGKYESEKMLGDASIIDVYNLTDRTYEFSFYFYNFKNEQINSFQVYNNILVGLTGKNLVICHLKKKFFK